MSLILDPKCRQCKNENCGIAEYWASKTTAKKYEKHNGHVYFYIRNMCTIMNNT